VKVLLVVDRSPYAEQAVRTLSNCFSGTEVEILHVLDLEANPHPHLSAALIDWYHKKIRALLQAEADKFLPKFQALLAPVSRSVTVSLQEGQTADVILRAAASSQSDLIVLGSRGLSEIQSLLLGGVSYRVVHEARCAVLLVRRELSAIRKILLAVDRSDAAELALRFLAEQSSFPPCRLMALTVCPSPPFAELLSESARHEATTSALKYLSEVESRLTPRGFTVEPAVVEGDPAATILLRAESEDIDLVVMGAGGRRGLLKRWLLGSVSRKVIAHTSKCMLIVHGDSGHVAGA
jgi:nucleotide-binding universal stress UspA family protein